MKATVQAKTKKGPYELVVLTGDGGFVVYKNVKLTAFNKDVSVIEFTQEGNTTYKDFNVKG